VSGPLDPNRLFPDGKYKHHVFLTQNDGTEREFNGVLKLSETEIILVGLSHFGSTVFQVKDLKGTPLEVTIYYEPMKKYELQFRDFYLSMKDVLVRRNNFRQKKKAKDEIQVTVGERDQNDIPENFEIVHPKFKVKVNVEGYEL
jgi:hypothetical protein